MERFRPNLVLDGLDAHGEDRIDELAFDTPGGPVRLKLGEALLALHDPRRRPRTGGATGHAVGDTLARAIAPTRGWTARSLSA